MEIEIQTAYVREIDRGSFGYAITWKVDGTYKIESIDRETHMYFPIEAVSGDKDERVAAMVRGIQFDLRRSFESKREWLNCSAEDLEVAIDNWDGEVEVVS